MYTIATGRKLNDADMLASERMFAKVWTTPTAKFVRQQEW